MLPYYWLIFVLPYYGLIFVLPYYGLIFQYFVKDRTSIFGSNMFLFSIAILHAVLHLPHTRRMTRYERLLREISLLYPEGSLSVHYEHFNSPDYLSIPCIVATRMVFLTVPVVLFTLQIAGSINYGKPLQTVALLDI